MVSKPTSLPRTGVLADEVGDVIDALVVGHPDAILDVGVLRHLLHREGGQVGAPLAVRGRRAGAGRGQSAAPLLRQPQHRAGQRSAGAQRHQPTGGGAAVRATVRLLAARAGAQVTRQAGSGPRGTAGTESRAVRSIFGEIDVFSTLQDKSYAAMAYMIISP